MSILDRVRNRRYSDSMDQQVPSWEQQASQFGGTSNYGNGLASRLGNYRKAVSANVPSWQQQSDKFDWNEAVDYYNGQGYSSPVAESSAYQQMLNNPSQNSWNEATNYYNSQDFGGAPADDGGLLSGAKDLMSNRDFMSGAMGLGQLGLGLANYFQQKPLYEEQLKGLRQNRDIQKDRYQRSKASANAFRTGDVSDRV